MSKSKMTDEERKAYEEKRDSIRKNLEKKEKARIGRLAKKLSRKEIVEKAILTKRKYDNRNTERKKVQSRKNDSDSKRPDLQRDLGGNKGVNNTELSKERSPRGHKSADLLPERGAIEVTSEPTETNKRAGNGASKNGKRKAKSKVKKSKAISVKNLIKK